MTPSPEDLLELCTLAMFKDRATCKDSAHLAQLLDSVLGQVLEVMAEEGGRAGPAATGYDIREGHGAELREYR